MKIKHVFIVFLAVSLLCSMACVSAFDNDNNTLNHDEIVLILLMNLIY